MTAPAKDSGAAVGSVRAEVAHTRPVPGAARYFAVGRDVLMQPVCEATGKFCDTTECVDDATTNAGARRKAEQWQKRENAAVTKAARR